MATLGTRLVTAVVLSTSHAISRTDGLSSNLTFRLAVYSTNEPAMPPYRREMVYSASRMDWNGKGMEFSENGTEKPLKAEEANAAVT